VRSTVDAIASSGAAGYEIIIVDDGSTDGSCVFLENEPREATTLFRQSRRGVAAARSAGAERATGDVLVFLDAHTAPQLGWLATLMREHATINANVRFDAIEGLGSDLAVPLASFLRRAGAGHIYDEFVVPALTRSTGIVVAALGAHSTPRPENIQLT